MLPWGNANRLKMVSAQGEIQNNNKKHIPSSHVSTKSVMDWREQFAVSCLQVQ